MTVLLLSVVFAVLAYVVSAALMPKPNCKCPPPHIPQRNGTCGVCARPLGDIQPHKVRIEEEPELEFDPSAFWLYPDWDGPVKEPFWMRPLKIPDRFANKLNFGQPLIPGVTYRTSSGGTIRVRDLAEEARTGVRPA